MAISPDAAKRAADTYNAASDFYDQPANSFWNRYGQRTVERLDLSPGARVLDACCGSGASAIPAAEAVGPSGQVLGVDLAERLLDLARAKAKNRGLTNIDFRAADILDLDLQSSSFDAVICVFGIFFVPDIPAAIRALWRLVKPGGVLAITNWGPRFFEPVNTALWDSVRKVRPDLYKGFNPWDRICEPEALRAALAAGDVHPGDVEVVAEHGSHPLSRSEDWWAMVLGTGYRGTIEQIDFAAREQVRIDCLRFIETQQVRSVESNVVYAVARKGLVSTISE